MNKKSNTNNTRQAQGGDAKTDRDLFCRIIMSQYLPVPEEPERYPLLQTSRDLQYRYRDMCTVTVSTVADVMQELGYKIDFVNGTPYWQMYEIKA